MTGKVCINANGNNLFVYSNVHGMSHIETANSPFYCGSPWAAIRARAMSQPVRLHTTLTALFVCHWLNCLLFQSHASYDWCISKRGKDMRGRDSFYPQICASCQKCKKPVRMVVFVGSTMMSRVYALTNAYVHRAVINQKTTASVSLLQREISMLRQKLMAYEVGANIMAVLWFCLDSVTAISQQLSHIFDLLFRRRTPCRCCRLRVSIQRANQWLRWMTHHHGKWVSWNRHISMTVLWCWFKCMFTFQ